MFIQILKQYVHAFTHNSNHSVKTFNQNKLRAYNKTNISERTKTNTTPLKLSNNIRTDGAKAFLRP